MSAEAEAMLDGLRSLGWKVRFGRDETWAWPLPRYAGRIPEEYVEFLRSFEECVRFDSKAWFLTRHDFSGASTPPYSWNQWEADSLEAANGDAEWQHEIKEFWDSTLPIGLSVDSGYAYLGIRLSDQMVVFGFEPEYENPIEVGTTFRELMRLIAKLQVPPAIRDFFRSPLVPVR